MDTLWLVAGFIVTWLLLCLIFPMSPLNIFRNAMEQHQLATVQFRDRWWWAWLNIVFFALFLGWPLCALVGGAGARRVARAFTSFRYKAEAMAAADPTAALRNKAEAALGTDATVVVGYATLIVVVLLTLSGNVLGEVERLWLFLMPPCCAYAATHLSQRKIDRRLVAVVLLLIVLQATQTFMMEMSLAPLVRPI
jgi:hypothetical protein